jgi:tripartite-type tricarboxylate transporter receptor subunit TctC
LGDILPPAMADALMQQIGINFIVDNKPGATRIIAARLAAAPKPDGAT